MTVPLVIKGRGAWSSKAKDNGSVRYTYISGKPLDGSTPEKDFNYEAVHLGTKAIQLRLNELVTGFTPLIGDGKYGPETATRTKAFQKKTGLLEDGAVGAITAGYLWRSLIAYNGRKYNFDPKYLWGQMQFESAGDPGAVGSSNSGDRGLVQINLPSHSEIILEEAFDSHFAFSYSAKRFSDALNKYAGNKERQLNASILQHNSPRNANLYYASGIYPTESARVYVSSILQKASTY